ncbi:MAG: hypothetical protein LC803_21150 [Acidobacteria bacterium]|nr:hypothetical protein [Acidobacteriota bacterium]
MNSLQIKQAVQRLSLAQLRRLDDWLHGVIQKAEESARTARPQSRKQIVEERTVENQTYRLEMIRCGKEKCKCARGELHGPYWYSYTRVKDKIKSQYIGKKLPHKIEKQMKNKQEESEQ